MWQLKPQLGSSTLTELYVLSLPKLRRGVRENNSNHAHQSHKCLTNNKKVDVANRARL